MKAHKGAIFGLAFSRRDGMLASAGGDGFIKLCNSSTLTIERTLSEHNGQIYAVQFDPTGKTLAWGGQGKVIKLWDVLSNLEVATLAGHSGQILSLAFAPDGKTLATGSGSGDAAVRLWDLASGQSQVIVDLQGFLNNVASLTFTPDGKRIVFPFLHGVKLWNISTQKEDLSLEGLPVAPLCISVSPDGKLVAAISQDFAAQGPPMVKLWEIPSGTHKRTFEINHGVVKSLAFSPNGAILATAGSIGDTTQSTGDIRLWDIATGRELEHFEGRGGPIISMAFSPDGKILVSGTLSGFLEKWKTDIVPSRP